ncbi:MAG: caspase family protein [Acidobacteriota bacterium]|nr:caspase family protein [Acidobacteriota bacterium]
MKILAIALSLTLFVASPANRPALQTPVSVNGITPLALIIGIDDYQHLTDLRGAVKDARNMEALLTAPDGFAIPKQNVITLLDSDATRANVYHAFRKGLIARARQGSPVIIYFSGHGGHAPDLNGDESDPKTRDLPDKLDEVLMLHDSGAAVAGLIDDDLNRFLLRLYQKTENITVILDACHTESATRTTGQPRFAGVPGKQGKKWGKRRADGGPGMVSLDPTYKPATMPKLVVITATADDAVAWDGPEGGLFTRALLPALGRVGLQTRTWRHVQQELQMVLAGTRAQPPHFQGALDQPVFGMTHRRKPITWRVTGFLKDKGHFLLEGPVPAGLETGAQLRTYLHNAGPADLLDPAKAHGMLEVVAVDGFLAEARIVAEMEETPVGVNNLAVPAYPGDGSVTLSLRFRPSKEPLGLGPGPREDLETAYEEHLEASYYLKLLEDDATEEADLEVVQRDGALILLDRGGGNRGQYGVTESYAASLLIEKAVNHAYIQRLKGLSGAAGPQGQNLVRVGVVEAKGKRRSIYSKNKRQSITLRDGQGIYVTVTLSKEAGEPHYVGGFVLSGDGSILGLPARKSAVLLEPGETHVFEDKGEGLQFREGKSGSDQLLFFACKRNMAWVKVAADTKRRGSAPGPGAQNQLFQGFHRYMTPGLSKKGPSRNTGSNTDDRFIQTMLTIEADEGGQ